MFYIQLLSSLSSLQASQRIIVESHSLGPWSVFRLPCQLPHFDTHLCLQLLNIYHLRSASTWFSSSMSPVCCLPQDFLISTEYVWEKDLVERQNVMIILALLKKPFIALCTHWNQWQLPVVDTYLGLYVLQKIANYYHSSSWSKDHDVILHPIAVRMAGWRRPAAGRLPGP